MSNPYNQTTLVGRFVTDPELKSTNSGKDVVNFTLVPLNPNKDAAPSFVDCVAWGPTAKSICEYFEKGKAILTTGHIETSTYENKEGKNIKKTEVIIDSWAFPPREKTENE